MNIFVFVYLLVFVLINRLLFSKIRDNALDLAKLNGINSDLLTAICQKKDKRRSLKKMAIEYFKTK
tara:strand:- start:135 stop:332 length:198 start_codon:yes stop_codon:yes gene_type:complete